MIHLKTEFTGQDGELFRFREKTYDDLDEDGLEIRLPAYAGITSAGKEVDLEDAQFDLVVGDAEGMVRILNDWIDRQYAKRGTPRGWDRERARAALGRLKEAQAKMPPSKTRSEDIVRAVRDGVDSDAESYYHVLMRGRGLHGVAHASAGKQEAMARAIARETFPRSEVREVRAFNGWCPEPEHEKPEPANALKVLTDLLDDILGHQIGTSLLRGSQPGERSGFADYVVLQLEAAAREIGWNDAYYWQKCSTEDPGRDGVEATELDPCRDPRLIDDTVECVPLDDFWPRDPDTLEHDVEATGIDSYSGEAEAEAEAEVADERREHGMKDPVASDRARAAMEAFIAPFTGPEGWDDDADAWLRFLKGLQLDELPDPAQVLDRSRRDAAKLQSAWPSLLVEVYEMAAAGRRFGFDAV